MFHASSRREIRRDWVCIALTLLAASSCSDSRAAARTSEPPAPTSWSLAKTPLANGDLQADTVLATIAPLQVLVRANDLPAAGARVIWKVSSDTAVTTSTTATDQNGIATLQFALGPRAGAYVAVAALDSVPGVAAVTFNLSAAPGNPAVLALVSGANQTDSATAVLKSDFVVRVADAHGNGVPGVTIQWAVTTGGGSISPTSSVTTAPDGQANAKLTLGRTAASNSAMATALGIDGPIAFSATATAAHAAQLAVISGDGQVAAVSQRLGTDDIVRVTDSYGNAVAGVTIDWAIANGGGALSASTSITSSDGTATTRSTLGPTPGTQTIVAAVDAAASVARVSFSATGVTSVSPPSGSPPPPPPPPSGPAQTLVLLSGDGQTGSVGSALPNLIVVQARDADGHGVRGQQISFTAGGTGAAVPAIAVTDDDGKAATSWRFGGDQGPQTLTVQASFTGTVLTVHATAIPAALAIVGDPSDNFDGLFGSIGIGQYASARVGPADSRVLASPLTVNFSHNSSRISVPASVTIATGGTSQAFRISGTSAGTETLTASAAGYTSANLEFSVGLGMLDFVLTGFPVSSLRVGGTNDVVLCSYGPNWNSNLLSAATTFALGPSANVSFSTEAAPSMPITSVTIPADDFCTRFVAHGLVAGAATITISSPNFQTLVTSLTVKP